MAKRSLAYRYWKIPLILRTALSTRSKILLRLALCCLCALLAPFASGQDGGRYAYTFLNLPISPRLAALGGKVPMLLDGPDQSLAVYNPANGLEAMHATVAAGFTLFYASVKYNHASYFHYIGKYGVAGVSLRQVWYGRMARRDIHGHQDGYFTAYDQALSLHYALPIAGGWRIGGSITPILSGIERYISVALAMDMGISYLSQNGNVSAGILCRNVGGSLKGYTSTGFGATPFELQAGVSLGLGYAPVRFTLVMQHLQNWRLRFSSQDTRNRVEGNAQWLDQEETNWQAIYRELFAHPIVGIEVFPVRYVSFQIGYHHRRRTEMAVEAKTYLEGFSWGLGVHYKRFGLHFARSLYHLHGASNHIAIRYQFGTPPPTPYSGEGDTPIPDQTIAL